MSFKEGSVVICGTAQSGCIVDKVGDDVIVLLLNGDLWYGSVKLCRFPQDDADLAACPLDVDRFEERDAAPRKLRED
jgi:hypothetical protein